MPNIAANSRHFIILTNLAGWKSGQDLVGLFLCSLWHQLSDIQLAGGSKRFTPCLRSKRMTERLNLAGIIDWCTHMGLSIITVSELLGFLTWHLASIRANIPRSRSDLALKVMQLHFYHTALIKRGTSPSSSFTLQFKEWGIKQNTWMEEVSKNMQTFLKPPYHLIMIYFYSAIRFILLILHEIFLCQVPL